MEQLQNATKILPRRIISLSCLSLPCILCCFCVDCFSWFCFSCTFIHSFGFQCTLTKPTYIHTNVYKTVHRTYGFGICKMNTELNRLRHAKRHEREYKNQHTNAENGKKRKRYKTIPSCTIPNSPSPIQYHTNRGKTD